LTDDIHLHHVYFTQFEPGQFSSSFPFSLAAGNCAYLERMVGKVGGEVRTIM
jgi:hypothetical protein